MENGLLEYNEIFSELLQASVENGYWEDHAGGDEREIMRIIDAGINAGKEKAIDPLADDFDDVEPPKSTVTIAQIMGDAPLETDEGYPQTHDGAIQAFVDAYSNELKFDHSKAMWFEFDGNTWSPESTGLAKDLARDVCVRLAQKKPKSGKPLNYKNAWDAVETGARNDRAFAAPANYWGRDPLLLGTPEGVVDLRNGEIREGLPEDNISKRTRVHRSKQNSFCSARAWNVADRPDKRAKTTLRLRWGR